ncbi:acyltransferase [Bacillus sp. AFS073361]|uniref:acyltransferase family protein n=1 Tax=Bacillus sp. AFS073361 TaxID=2033511 RepID=UPI0015D48486|nr:acyltransferase [Bacillus sp. AFS073361]
MKKKNEFQFSKKMTSQAKGLAILLMVYHHLFTFPDRISSVDYAPLMMFNGQPLDQLIGAFGKICVSIFLFTSGYGLYQNFLKNNSFTFKVSLKKIIQFLKTYWIIFIIFIPIGLIWFHNQPRYVFNLKNFLLNFTSLTNTYNREWWFVPLYLELIIIFPILIKLIEKIPLIVNYLSFISLFFAGFFQNAILLFPNNILIQLLMNHLSVLLLWQVVFIVGIYFSKYSVFEKINQFLNRLKLENILFYLIVLFICFYIRQFTLPWIIEVRGAKISGIYTYADFILTPILIFSFVKIVSYTNIFSKLFATLGKHSNNIWLTHTFFIYYYYQKIIFLPYFSILIVGWVFILTIVVSICVNFISNKINFLDIKKQSTVNKSLLH